jgi:hypothetical protein
MLERWRNEGFRSEFVRWLRGIGLALSGVLLVAGLSHAGFLDASWTAPTTNTDGSPLTDLASYRVYHGSATTPCPGTAFFQVASPTPSPAPNTTVSFRLAGLPSGIPSYVSVSAVDQSGNEGACSTIAGAIPHIDVSEMGITPNPMDLAAAPRAFTITGVGLANLGAGLPVVNFVSNEVLLGQARATQLVGTALTVPFPTNRTSLSGALQGLSAGSVTVSVYNQVPGGAGFNLVGSANLSVGDTRCMTCAVIAPSPVDRAVPPSSFTITGSGFADLGAGLPVVNFVAGGYLVGQARAIDLAGGTTLTVPFPTDQTSLSGPLAGLSTGHVTVFVFNQVPSGGFNLVGGTNLTVSN